jgi:putative Mn2+ efflux pump MntP
MNALGWFVVSLPLALDVFAVGLVFGLAGLERMRWLSVALTFAAIGGTMIALGILLGDALSGAMGTAALFVAAIVLLAIGLRAIAHGLGGSDSPKVAGLDSRRIATTAIAVAVDKLAVGLSFSVLDAPLGMMVVIVGGQAFVATLLGLVLGKRMGTRAGDAAEIIAGVVFTVLGLIVLYKAFASRA